MIFISFFCFVFVFLKKKRYHIQGHWTEGAPLVERGKEDNIPVSKYAGLKEICLDGLMRASVRTAGLETTSLQDVVRHR